jgi:hypothetical protein
MTGQHGVPRATALLVLALALATPQLAGGQVPVPADFAVCNAEAMGAVKAGSASPTKDDHARADRARAATSAPKSGDSTRAAIESSDPQIHGMEAEGAKQPPYQAAYRSCMRRRGF